MFRDREDNMMFILYVENQEKSKLFYEHLLGEHPVLDVPGMTEFRLSDMVTLGIMPEDGIVRILDHKIPHPKNANRTPRSEIYLFVHDPDEYYRKLIEAGGTGIRETERMSWRDSVSYGADLDGHILAFAKHDQP